MVKGTVVADTLSVARITVDLLRNPVKVHALAGIVNSTTGQTVAWTEGSGGVWSASTMAKLRELRESMETDLGAKIFGDNAVNTGGPLAPTTPTKPSGLGEHIGDAAEPPSV